MFFLIFLWGSLFYVINILSHPPMLKLISVICLESLAINLWIQATRTDKVDQTTLLDPVLAVRSLFRRSGLPPWLSPAVLVGCAPLTDWWILGHDEWCPNNSWYLFRFLLGFMLFVDSWWLLHVLLSVCRISSWASMFSVIPTICFGFQVSAAVCVFGTSCFGKAAGSVSVWPLSVEGGGV